MTLEILILVLDSSTSLTLKKKLKSMGALLAKSKTYGSGEQPTKIERVN
jgi:hypothetical protein